MDSDMDLSDGPADYSNAQRSYGFVARGRSLGRTKGQGLPESLKAYARQAFETCRDEKEKTLMEKRLKSLITKSIDNKTLHTTRWDREPIPQLGDPATHNDLGGFMARTRTSLENPVVGTCTDMEKKYFRLTSAPRPELIRPLSVLKKALVHVLEKWKEKGDYAWYNDQMKSIRQDLTVQQIQNTFTVYVYEIHARVAIEKHDLAEYNQCQTQLKFLYEILLRAQGHELSAKERESRVGNVLEFLAYRILYLIHTGNHVELNRLVGNLTTREQQNLLVSHALQVRRAISTNDYPELFRLYHNASHMSPYLMDHFVPRERCKALVTICSAYWPHISVAYIQRTLLFGTLDEAREWLAGQCKAILVENPQGWWVDTRASLTGAMQARQESTRVLEIRGQM